MRQIFYIRGMRFCLCRRLLGAFALVLLVPPAAGAQSPAAKPGLSLQPAVSEPVKEAIGATSVFLQDPPIEASGSLALQREIAHDRASLHLLLNNFGYYDPVVLYRSDEGRVTGIEVDSGPLYLLTHYTVQGLPAGLTAPGAALGRPALARELLENEEKILTLLADNGYPLARYSQHAYVADHARRVMEADLVVDPGLPLVFGSVQYTGQQRTRPSYLRRLVPWQGGQTYSAAQVESYRQTLLDTGLFSVVRAQPATSTPDGHTLPVAFELAERPARTLGGSLGYDSDRGLGGEVFWQHRNLMGRGEQLELTGKAYQNQQSLSAAFRVPHWPDTATSLISSLKFTNEQSDAYNESGLLGELGLERKLSPVWSASFGGRVRLSDVNSQTVASLALPFTLSADTSDSKLDPTHGLRSATILTPVFSLSGEQAAFATWEQRLSAYWPLARHHKVVMAGWAHVGGVVAASVNDIAPTSRFYAGGGGSVRGYAFRSIGERDSSGDPLGGTALAEGGLELRFPVHNEITGVVFAEAGSVSATTLPDFSDPRYAAGAGIRYVTSFAPLRFDVAVPLNPRDDDSRFQIYLSIGQAF